MKYAESIQIRLGDFESSSVVPQHKYESQTRTSNQTVTLTTDVTPRREAYLETG
jgi:hypothetical protein